MSYPRSSSVEGSLNCESHTDCERLLVKVSPVLSRSVTNVHFGSRYLGNCRALAQIWEVLCFFSFSCSALLVLHTPDRSIARRRTHRSNLGASLCPASASPGNILDC